MGSQSCKSFSCGNFETLTWEPRDKMTFGCWSRG
jgi:secreted Zn-dependent insulinase-like peptidase